MESYISGYIIRKLCMEETPPKPMNTSLALFHSRDLMSNLRKLSHYKPLTLHCFLVKLTQYVFVYSEDDVCV